MGTPASVLRRSLFSIFWVGLKIKAGSRRPTGIRTPFPALRAPSGVLAGSALAVSLNEVGSAQSVVLRQSQTAVPWRCDVRQ